MIKVPQTFARNISSSIWNGPLDTVVDSKPIVIRELIKLGIHIDRAAERADQYCDNVSNFMKKALNDFADYGLIPYFKPGISRNAYVGCAWENPVDSSETKEMKQRLALIVEMRDYIEGLDAVKFELLSTYIFNLCSPTKSYVLGRQKDGGVDFYGVYDLPPAGKESWWYIEKGLDTPDYWRGLFETVEIRIIGQAKRYNQPVTEDDVILFSGQVDRIRKGQGRAIKKLPEWFTKSPAPIECIMMSSSQFSKGALEVAKEEKVKLRNVHHITQDIVLLDRGIALTDSPPVFNYESLKDHLKTIELHKP